MSRKEACERIPLYPKSIGQRELQKSLNIPYSSVAAIIQYEQERFLICEENGRFSRLQPDYFKR